MGFEQLKYSPPQSATSQQRSPEKHKLISHSKQEDKKPQRSSVVQRVTWLHVCLLFVQF